MSEKPYTLRHLTAGDVFPMLKIIRKIGIQNIRKCFDTDEIKAMVKAANDGEKAADESAIGMNVVMDAVSLLVEKLPDCEAEIYGFLGGLTGMGRGELAALKLTDFMNLLIDIFSDSEFSDFFTAVARLVQ